MVVVAQLAVLPYVPFRMAIGACFLGDRLEIAGIAEGVEVGLTTGEIRLGIEHMAPPATLSRFAELSRLGVEQPQMNAV